MTSGERIIIIPPANPINAFAMRGITKDAEMTVGEFKGLL